MRILISDYSGHPFQVQLSRELAARGHDIVHVHSESFQTPKGRLDADERVGRGSLKIIGVRTRQAFAKNSFLKRRQQEIEIGRRIAEQILAVAPDVVVSSNAPLDTQQSIQRAAKQVRAGFVFWVQDLYSEAILRVLGRRFGPIGALIGRYYQRVEGRLIRDADHLVVIAPEFVGPVRRLGNVEADRITVVENWAPLEEVDQWDRQNEWALSRLPDSPFRAVYSGTLGFKHNPGLLFRLAKKLKGDVIVFSEGPAAESLKSRAAAEGVDNLHVAGWLPFDELPKALGGADLLIVILEPDAGAYSVPSKCLTYMCAGRPILAAIPESNLAARLIRENQAGWIVEPTDEDAFVAAAKSLSADAERRAEMGRNARKYAETAFDIRTIGSRFEEILSTVNRQRRVSYDQERTGLRGWRLHRQPYREAAQAGGILGQRS